ncbi:LANO_0B00848g1_1 [Lachancea nothofagi CBS 11611]|uniref:LANO_0B00848g1_1 n=1 Tax=Lachancea nothofagi CBS 11611 TaxID=1266666 RepID=A0A1G4IUP0_9SACH|nr:LANO_0B00848g1_1 [Lachancea nothofagi CBS 11611]
MVLEAAVLIVDNSEFSRNGDFPRTRFEAQIDAVEFLFQAKRNSNPENSVGLISSAGSNPQVLSTFTSEFGKILAGLHDTTIGGETRLTTAIQIAALTLKHRQNKVQHQRVIAFVCSPLPESERDELMKLAKKLKKNKIAVDVVNFGEIDSNTSILEEFIQTVNNPQEESSHLATVSPGPRLLYEHVAASPIVLEEGAEPGFGGVGGSGMGGGDNFMDFGVDPSMDPELALALRLSMEEEQARQERLRQEQENSTGTKNEGPSAS